MEPTQLDTWMSQAKHRHTIAFWAIVMYFFSLWLKLGTDQEQTAVLYWISIGRQTDRQIDCEREREREREREPERQIR